MKIKDLPKVAVEDRHLLPSKRGIYFILTASSQLLYIGKSVDIRSRWWHHQKMPKVENKGCFIAYWVLDQDADIDRLESKLINWCKPILNERVVNVRRAKYRKKKQSKVKRVNQWVSSQKRDKKGQFGKSENPRQKLLAVRVDEDLYAAVQSIPKDKRADWLRQLFRQKAIVDGLLDE